MSKMHPTCVQKENIGKDDEQWMGSQKKHLS